MTAALGQSDVQVIAHALRCPLGASAMQTAMAIRAGLRAPRPSRLMDSRHCSVVLGQVGLPDDRLGFDRFAALGASVLGKLDRALLEPPVPLLLALPEAGRPDLDHRWGTVLLAEIAKQAGITLDVERSAAFLTGHAAFASALGRGIELLRAGDASLRVVLVGGIDSYYHPEVVRWLEAENRLCRPGSPDGLVPGEAAAVLALSCTGVAPTPHARGAGPSFLGAGERERMPLATVCAVDVARLGEPSARPPTPPETLDDELPPEARATGALLGRLIESCPQTPLEWTLTDVNGEARRVREWTVAWQEQRRPGARHDRPADYLGDVGAASGPLCVALAASYWQAQCAPSSSVLVALHSDGPARGALVLQAPRPERLQRRGASS